MMKRQFAKMMLIGVSGFLVMGGSLQAENGLRVEIAESSLSRMEEMRLDAKYATCEESPVECAVQENSNNLEEETFAQYLIIDGKVNHYKEAFNRLSGISNDMIEMQNGSAWLVNPRDVSRMYTWMPGVDDIVVMQDTSWFFSRYKYRLVNTITGDVVAADMKLGPFLDRVRLIEGINPNTRTIELSDGSLWKISGWDDSIYYDKSANDLSQRRWLKTDAIIVGANASYIGGPFILINVNVNKVARATLINRY